MKTFLLLSLWGFASAQDGDEPNITSTPTMAPTAAPTPYQTPEGPFEYEPWGATAFGYKFQDIYLPAHQHSIRRPGWSWDEPLAGSGPFCFNQTCYNVTDACNSLGGTVLSDSYCSFPESVKIAGPSCWEDDCETTGQSVCKSVGGITVGDSSVEWCLFTGDRTIFGPACYNGVCYQDELRDACSSVGGSVWNSNYCIIDDYYTVVGPVCWRGACFSGALKNACADELGGVSVADRWCLIRGCDRTVVGPTCSFIPDNIQDQCYEEETKEMCSGVGGVLIADRFCVIEGTDWTFLGPNGYLETERILDTNRFCRELTDDLEAPFNELETYNVAGRFCLVNTRIPPAGPYCIGGTCHVSNNTDFCADNGGKEIGPIMCALPPSYRRAEGPLVWGGRVLPSTALECDGLFCAIPEPNSGENLRCPSSTIKGAPPGNPTGTKSPSGPSNPSAATTLQVAFLVGTVMMGNMLW